MFSSYWSTVRHISAGYLLFRLTADLERLPYPMAPIAAQGATALAETTGRGETWKWRIFSIGSMAGFDLGVHLHWCSILNRIDDVRTDSNS